jgi:hypothetical protein
MLSFLLFSGLAGKRPAINQLLSERAAVRVTKEIVTGAGNLRNVA